MVIRGFETRDAEAVSRVIHDNLIRVNSRDYESSVIDYMCQLFTPVYLQELSVIRDIFVAEERLQVVGTIGLNGDEVCALYVAPDLHGCRIGEGLLCRVEEVAETRGISVLHLSASLTAVRFYEKKGYRMGEKVYSEQFGPAFIMTKEIGAAFPA